MGKVRFTFSFSFRLERTEVSDITFANLGESPPSDASDVFFFWGGGASDPNVRTAVAV